MDHLRCHIVALLSCAIGLMAGCSSNKQEPGHGDIATPVINSGVTPSSPPMDGDKRKQIIEVTGRFVAVFEEAAREALRYPHNCDRAAAAISDVVDHHRDAIDAMQRSDDEASLHRRFDALENEFGTRVENTMRSLEPLLDRCIEHTALGEALETLRL